MRIGKLGESKTEKHLSGNSATRLGELGERGDLGDNISSGLSRDCRGNIGKVVVVWERSGEVPAITGRLGMSPDSFPSFSVSYQPLRLLDLIRFRLCNYDGVHTVVVLCGNECVGIP